MQWSKKLLTVFTLGVLGFATMASADTLATENTDDLLPADQLEEELLATESLNEENMDSSDAQRWVEYECVARSSHGRRFHARAQSPRYAQRRALDRCYRSGAHHCYAGGCRRI